MDMDDDPDPEMPPGRTPTHPIEISDGSSFHGSPYRGPDSYEARFASYPWEFTPPFIPPQQQQQDPSEDSRFQAVTPPPPPPPEQQPPPEPLKRRRSGARMAYGASYQTGYPAYGYQYPPPLQPQPQQQPQPPFVQPPQQQEIIQRLNQVERDVQRERRSRRGLLKGLADLIKGKNKRDY
ncbi:early nodulin-75-like [Helianthus annuus]|uniref:early nodulin-75-like n=1 Tax=Helianthus annuus TaxID=4232 RepID=UPI000B8F9F74|nr:early nodulin-75-like [Helianthus annuus]